MKKLLIAGMATALLIAVMGGCVSSATMRNAYVEHIEADKRGIIFIRYNDKDKSNNVLKTKWGFCAEPSPDAILTNNFRFDSTVDIPDAVKLSAGLSNKETFNQIGDVESITKLARELQYRQCEAHLQGIQNKESTESILNFLSLYSITNLL